MEYSQTERAKIRYQQINFDKNIQEVEALFWTFGICSNVMLFGDNRYKMWTSFKTIISKNPTT